VTQGAYTVPTVVIPAVAYKTGRMDHFDLVETIASAIFSLPVALLAYLHAARIGLGLIAVQRQDETAASELYSALKSTAGILAPQSSNGPGLVVDRLLGLLSRIAGNLDQAAVHFEEALVFCRKDGCRPELAWTCYDYAGMLVQRNLGDDRGKAIALLKESLIISSDLGMRPLAVRVVGFQELAEAAPVRMLATRMVSPLGKSKLC